MTYREIEFRRVELFELLWAQPIKQLAGVFGVSGSEVKRAALAMEVPMPPVGHWTKVEFGNAKAKPELPSTDGPETYVHRVWIDAEEEEVTRRIGLIQTQAVDVAVSLGLPTLRSSVAECLPIIKKMAAALKKSYPDSRNWPNVGHMGMFELRVSPQNQERALLTFDRALRHCHAEGIKIRSVESDREPATLLVDDVRVHCSHLRIR